MVRVAEGRVSLGTERFLPWTMADEVGEALGAARAAGFSVVEAGGIYQVLSERGYSTLVGLLWVALGFLVLVIPLTLLQRNLEKRWSVHR